MGMSGSVSVFAGSASGLGVSAPTVLTSPGAPNGSFGAAIACIARI